MSCPRPYKPPEQWVGVNWPTATERHPSCTLACFRFQHAYCLSDDGAQCFAHADKTRADILPQLAATSRPRPFTMRRHG